MGRAMRCDRVSQIRVYYKTKGDKMKDKKRFTETVSTAMVHDNKTGKEYRCEYRIDDKLLEVMNDIDDYTEFLEKRIIILEEACKVYDEFIKKQGYTVKDIWKGFNEN